MGGKTAGGGLGGGGGKGGGGARGPMTAEQADAANQTRRQNIFTTVGGLSNPGTARGKAAGGLTTPPSPRIRPTGPGGPGADGGVPLPPTRPADASPGAGISAATLPGAYGRSAVPNAQTGLPEGAGNPPLASLFGPETTGPTVGPYAPGGAAAEAARKKRLAEIAAMAGRV